MTFKKRGLGRGLEALLVDVDTGGHTPHTHTVPINSLQQNNALPDEALASEELQELAYSIIAAETVEPIHVRKLDDTHFAIIEGENRLMAAQLAGLEEIQVIIEESDDNAEALAALIENLQQENLQLLQEAENLKQLLAEFEALVAKL
ncbi:MAG: ParB/RepB/Spo0J family partition protein [Methylococcaceae bacterium]|nr:ParB/RepB/Spo0J family partition protein [Methylococcaceae bacterium]